MMMKRRILIVVIIVVLVIIMVLGISGCQRKQLSVLMKEELSIYDLNSALASGKIEIINEEVFVKLAIVKEISGRNLTIKVLDIGKGREEAFYLAIPVSQRFPGIKVGDFIEIHLDLSPDNTMKEVKWLLMV